MDGNGRWAAEQGKPRSYGHQAGVDAVRRITSECTRLGVKYLTLYTFSTENWNRPATEVAALMGLVLTSLEDEIFMKNNVRFQVIGDIERLPKEVQQKLQETMEHTANNSAMTMVVALSYSRDCSRPRCGQDCRYGHQRATHLGAHDHKLHARPRPAHTHRWRTAHQQLPALADCILRTLLLRHLLARLRRGRLTQSHRRLSATPATLRQNRSASRG